MGNIEIGLMIWAGCMIVLSLAVFIRTHIDEKNSKHVIVPIADIEKIEEARAEIYRLHDGCDTDMLINLSSITNPMWELTHKRYPKA